MNNNQDLFLDIFEMFELRERFPKLKSVIKEHVEVKIDGYCEDDVIEILSKLKNDFTVNAFVKNAGEDALRVLISKKQTI